MRDGWATVSGTAAGAPVAEIVGYGPDDPRCPENRTSVPSPITTVHSTRACVGCVRDRPRPSPSPVRVGVHDSTFEACSRFTRGMARRLAHRSMRATFPAASTVITRPAALDATETNRQLLRWIFHPLVLCAFVRTRQTLNLSGLIYAAKQQAGIADPRRRRSISRMASCRTSIELCHR